MRARLRRLVLVPAWLGVGALVLFGLAGGAVPPAVQYVPLLASLLVLGLPHGAVDHLVLLRQRGAPLRWRPLLGVVAPYLALAGLYGAVWLAAPLAAFGFFILLTWFHWGQGDLHGLLFLSGARHLPRRWQRGLAVAVRGGLPMLVPLLAFPEIYREVAGAVTGVIDPAAGAGAGWWFTAPPRIVAGSVFAGLVLVHAVAGFRAAGAAGRAAWAEDVFETVLLAGFFATVHPVFAVGVYFCLWHAPRHIARLLAEDDGAARHLRAGAVAPALGRFARQAWPTTLAAVGLLGLLYLLVPHTPARLPELVGLYLVLIAVLTAPHVWVVCRMDRAQGVWRPGGGAAR